MAGRRRARRATSASVLLPFIPSLTAAAIHPRAALNPASSTDALPYVSTYEVVLDVPIEPTVLEAMALGPDGTTLVQGAFQSNDLRAIDAFTGAVLRRATPNAFPSDLITMGVAIVGNTTIQGTYLGPPYAPHGTVLEYSYPALMPVQSVNASTGPFNFGMGSDGKETLYASDGTNILTRLDASHDYRVLSRVAVFDAQLNRNISELYDLQVVGDEVWATLYPLRGVRENVYNASSECVVRIDPATGVVRGWVDLRGLLKRQRAVTTRTHIGDQGEQLTLTDYPYSNIMVGIAYVPRTDTLLISGKNWDRLYHVRLVPAPSLGTAHVESVCNLSTYLSPPTVLSR